MSPVDSISEAAPPMFPSCQSPPPISSSSSCAAVGSDILSSMSQQQQQQLDTSSVQELASISEVSPSCSPQPPIAPAPEQTVFDHTNKIYESLKSQGSSSSDGGGAEGGGGSSVASSVSVRATATSDLYSKPTKNLIQKEDSLIPDTEDPELINSLNFVSPKSGVYRPSSGGKKGIRQNCSIM